MVAKGSSGIRTYRGPNSEPATGHNDPVTITEITSRKTSTTMSGSPKEKFTTTTSMNKKSSVMKNGPPSLTLRLQGFDVQDDVIKLVHPGADICRFLGNLPGLLL